jgi:hypothetical protein
LCTKSAAAVSSRCNSRRSVHRQHRLQRLPDSETRHSRGRPVLHTSQHRSHLRARASRRRILCLRHGYSPFFVGRATFLTISETSGTTKVASRFFFLLTSAFSRTPACSRMLSECQPQGQKATTCTPSLAERMVKTSDPAEEGCRDDGRLQRNVRV